MPGMEEIVNRKRHVKFLVSFLVRELTKPRICFENSSKTRHHAKVPLSAAVQSDTHQAHVRQLRSKSEFHRWNGLIFQKKRTSPAHFLQTTVTWTVYFQRNTLNLASLSIGWFPNIGRTGTNATHTGTRKRRPSRPCPASSSIFSSVCCAQKQCKRKLTVHFDCIHFILAGTDILQARKCHRVENSRSLKQDINYTAA